LVHLGLTDEHAEASDDYSELGAGEEHADRHPSGWWRRVFTRTRSLKCPSLLSIPET
jgi:hypothetical protein